MAEIWGAAIAATIGAGVSMYGANKQAKAQQAAQNENAQLQDQKNNSAWQAYLMSRGLNPMGATAGTIPVGAPAINTRLPLWANINVAVPKGTNRIGQLTRTAPAAVPAWYSTPSNRVAPTSGRSWAALGFAA